jgi:hypothetical protein
VRRNFDNDINLVWNVFSRGYSIEVHVNARLII